MKYAIKSSATLGFILVLCELLVLQAWLHNPAWKSISTAGTGRSPYSQPIILTRGSKQEYDKTACLLHRSMCLYASECNSEAVSGAKSALGVSLQSQKDKVKKFIACSILAWSTSIPHPTNAFPMPECSDSVVVLRQHSTSAKADADDSLRQITMIGTAHISEDSANLVHRTIQSLHPDTIMIELDPKRVGRADQSMSSAQLAEAGFVLPQVDAAVATATGVEVVKSDSSSVATETSQSNSVQKSPNFFQRVIINPIVNNAQKLAGAVLGKALGQFYSSVEKLGFTAGGEFRAAVEESRKIGAKVLLGDRDVDVTLRRLATAISTTDSEKLKNVMDKLSAVEEELGLAVDDDSPIDKEQMQEFVEGIKQKETINRIMAIVKEEVPDIYNALVGERDQFMSSAIAKADSKNLVGVVGLAHMKGIVSYLNQAGYDTINYCSSSK